MPKPKKKAKANGAKSTKVSMAKVQAKPNAKSKANAAAKSTKARPSLGRMGRSRDPETGRFSPAPGKRVVIAGAPVHHPKREPDDWGPGAAQASAPGASWSAIATASSRVSFAPPTPIVPAIPGAYACATASTSWNANSAPRAAPAHRLPPKTTLDWAIQHFETVQPMSYPQCDYHKAMLTYLRALKTCAASPGTLLTQSLV
jgi:hypothetical protein